MKGWLVVNGFVHSQKFSDLYGYLLQSAQNLGVDLTVVPSHTLQWEVASPFPFDKPDFVLFWDKDVTLAHRLEKCGLRLFNNATAVEICDSKVKLATTLCGVVPMPQTILSPLTFPDVGYPDLSFVDNAINTLGLPLIVKEEHGSFGQQVYLATSAQQAKNLVQTLAKQGKAFVLQRFVESSRGTDVRLNVVGGKVVNAVLRHSQTDFRSNVTLGGSMQKYQPTLQQQEIAIDACNAIGLDFAGVDVLLGETPLLCEVNSNPHFKSTLDCTGVDLSQHILQQVLQQI